MRDGLRRLGGAWPGQMLGPTVGGLLAFPATNYPATFGAAGPLGWAGLWESFPYLLPCVVAVALGAASDRPGTNPPSVIGNMARGRPRGAAGRLVS